MKKSKKLFVIIVAFVLVFAFTTTAFASFATFNEKHVTGGDSDRITWGYRNNSSTIDFKVTMLNWNGESDWKISGHWHNSSTLCSNVKPIPGLGTYHANYAGAVEWVDIFSSIYSSMESDYLIFTGNVTY